MRILIAEDQPDSRLLLQKVLEGAGHQVTVAIHGRDALEKAKAEPPELIISDIMMPVMDGFKLCYAVKLDEKLSQIPFIFYTATYVDLEDERLAMGMGASRYLIKPMDPPEFLQILNEVIAEAESGRLSVPTDPLQSPMALSKMCSSSLSRKLEKKVRELEIYKAIFNGAKNPTAVLSPEGLFLHINPAHSALFGYLENQIQGESAALCLGEKCLAAVLKNAASQAPYQTQIETVAQNGKQLYLDISTSVIRDETGATSAILSICRDLTKVRESERELLLFRNLIDQSNDSIFIIDPVTSSVLDVNQQSCERRGYSKTEMLKLKVSDLNPSLQTEENLQTILATLKEQKTAVLETDHLTKTGEAFPVEVSLRYIEDQDSHYIIAVARDISERRAAEKREREAQREWERTFNASRDIITIQDLQCRITLCNTATAEAFELSQEEIIGQHCYELFNGSDKICAGCPITQVTATFEPYVEEIYHPKLDKTFSVNVSPVLDESGGIRSIAHFAKDITEQKKLEEQLRQAQKMESLGTLAGGIAHDFNNILSAILGYAQLAKLHSLSDSKVTQDLEQVIIGGKRAAELVAQILTFSRKTKYQTTSVDLTQVIAEAIKLLRSSIPATIEIKQDIEPDCPAILADSGQLHQIIMNLCTNAYHAMREQKNGLLEISLQTKEFLPGETVPQLNILPGSYLQLTISDNGSGMDEATRKKIFEPYFTTKEQGEGTGLGLAVVHGIVQSFGGQISVYSEPGQGTSFKIYLPVSEAGADQAEVLTSHQKVPMGTERLLVVDDEKPIANLFKAMLGRYGYQVTTCSESPIALQAFRLNPDLFDLVITDYAMPEMNGIDLAEEILNIRAKIPILLCTGFSDRNNHDKALRVGIKACLNKPIQAEELAGAVRNVLDAAEG